MASPAAILQVLVEANTGEATASLYKLQGTMEKTAVVGKEMSAANAGIVTSSGKATKAHKEHGKAVSKLGGSMKGLLVGTGALIGAYAGYSAVKSAVSYTEELVHQTEVLTKVTGLSAREASQWVELAKQRGIATSKLQIGFSTLSKQIRGAETGSSTAAKGFHALGISMDSLRKLSTQEVMEKVADGLKNTQNYANKAALTQQFFGKSGRELLPILAQGSKALDNQLGKFSGLSGAQFKAGLEARELQRKIGRAYDEIRLKVTFALLDAGKATAAWIKETAHGKGVVGEWGRATIKWTTNAANNAVHAFQQMVHWTQGIIKSLKDFYNQSPILQAYFAAWKKWAQIAAVVWKTVLVGAFNFAHDVIKRVIPAIVQIVKGFAQVIRGIVKVISGVLTLNFKRTWEGVKEIFKGGIEATWGILRAMSAPLRSIIGHIGDVMGRAFGAVWHGVKEVFEDGINAVKGLVGDILDVIEKIPGVPDLQHPSGGGGKGPQHSLGADKGENRKGSKGLHRQHRARGGPIFGGDASGDSIPAMLERGEYVLNRKAVKALGKKQLDAINFAAAPRFSIGSFIGKTPAAKAVSAIGSAAGGLGLPTPHLPKWMGGLGSYLIAQVGDWIKGQKKKMGRLSGVGAARGPKGVGSYMGLPMANWVIESLLYAASKGVKPQPTSGYRPGFDPHTVTGYSEHSGTQYPHGAVDFGGYNTGLAAKMSVVRATSNFKYPLLAPIGFVDYGHASGTGHQKGGMPSWVHGGSTLGADQLASLAHYAGMANPGLMSQIAQAESGGNPRNMGSAGDKGLWQIIPSTAATYGIPYGGLFDPLANARGAAKVLAGQGLGAWSTYKSGAYRGYPKGHVSAIVGAAAAGAGGSARKAVKRIMGIGSSAVAGAPFIPRGTVKEAIGKGKSVISGPLGEVPLPASMAGLAPNFQKLLSSPGLSYAGQQGIAGRALEAAGRTPGISDDLAVLAFQEDLYKGHLTGLQKRLNRVNKKLTGHLKPGRQKKLLARREELLGQVGEAEGGIEGAQEARKQLEEEAAEKQREATEELTHAIEEHAAIEKEVRDELKAQTQFAERATATKEASAWKALSDILAGNLGAIGYAKAQKAGTGIPGSAARL